MNKTKKVLLKYFKPVEMDDILAGAFDDDLDIESSLGTLAYQTSDSARFLNRLSTDDFMQLMKKVGLIEHLNNIGFLDIEVEIKKDEALMHHLKVYDREINPDNLLINLRVSESRFVPEQQFFEDNAGSVVLDMVIIEWLSAQNPSMKFKDSKPQLPGQNKPGLGSLSYMMDIMYLVGENLLIDGFMDIPNHFHGAVMYSRKFKFFNPAHEAILKAMLRDLKDYSMVDLSWGMLTKTILETNSGKPQEYDPSEQIFPVSDYMKKYFTSKKYMEKYKNVYKKKNYFFEYEKMLKIRNEVLREKNIEEL